MSYPRRASFADVQRSLPDFQRAQAGRARGGSDATLVNSEYRPFEKKGYGQPTTSGYPLPKGYAPNAAALYEDQSPSSRPSSTGNAYRASQAMAQRRDPSQMRRRTIHSQMQMPAETQLPSQTHNNFEPQQQQYMFTEAPSQSHHNNCDDNRCSGFPHSQHPAAASAMPYGCFVMHPPNEKKSGFASKLKEAFIETTTNKSYLALGCKPGQPTPLNILYKEEAEEAVAQAKRASEFRRKEEEAMRCKVKRYEEYMARVEAGQQGHAQMQKKGKKGEKKAVKPSPKAFTSRRGPAYNAWLAEEYARRNEMND